MKVITNILIFLKLPLQIILGAYISFVLIAMTIAYSEHKQKLFEAEHEARPTITQS